MNTDPILEQILDGVNVNNREIAESRREQAESRREQADFRAYVVSEFAEVKRRLELLEHQVKLGNLKFEHLAGEDLALLAELRDLGKRVERLESSPTSPTAALP